MTVPCVRCLPVSSKEHTSTVVRIANRKNVGLAFNLKKLASLHQKRHFWWKSINHLPKQEHNLHIFTSSKSNTPHLNRLRRPKIKHKHFSSSDTMTSSSATASAYPMWMIQKHAKALRYCIYSTYLYIYITSHRKWYVSIHGQGRSWLVVVEVVDVVMATNMSTRWIIVTHNTHKTPYFFHPPGCHLHSSCDFCRIISHQKREMNSFHPNCTLCCSRFVFYIYVYVVLYRYITGEISICLPVYTWYDQTTV